MTKREAEGVALLGVRHHGPGSARAVAAALEQYRPDIVLIEGPPEADALLGFAADKAMVPPVALLAHVVDDPARAAFWPFAGFSPEWVALRHALDRDLPVHFIDLPAGHSLALGRERQQDAGLDAEQHAEQDGHREQPPGRDPIAELALAAGHDDPEQWWEDAVEHRLPEPGGDALAPFQAVAEAMAELRTGAAEGSDALREAHMRKQLRAARRAGHQRIAVVCGAWHVPALAARPPVAEDNALLKGVPKAKVELTWVPWTNRRLGRHTGYGAGIASPGWYQHLFEAPDRTVVRWLTRVAALLRAEDYSVSSAHVIEAARLAETLAAVRGRPLPGLAEATDAVRAVLCEGSDVPLALVHDRLVVGDRLGEVPEDAPAVPLHRDLARLQRTLRLKPDPDERELDLDLRRDLDAARSRLLHRLRLLGIHWGRPAESRTASTGTFRECWRLRWEPELAVSIAEAGIWGTTVEAAACARAIDRAISAASLGEVTALAETCLLADLPEALGAVLKALADRAALDADVAHLAEALPALVRSLRYGDVRGTDASALRRLAEGLAVRVCVGLPPACANLDADGATAMAVHLAATHTAVALLTDAPPTAGAADAPDTVGAADAARAPDGGGLAGRWSGTLRALARRDTVPGLLRGRAVRLLLDDNQWDADEAARQLGLALSAASQPTDAAGWIEGFLAGGGMLLVHDTRLLGLVDDWITTVPEAAFPDVLPLLRRTFSGFEAAVRRTVGERIRAVGGASGASGAPGGEGGADRPGFAAEPDPARAARARATAALLLGLTEAQP
ncbi:hypothetical protein GXW83_29680 [Streptacidiphilus sp. PB12-B1b]|uniref:DUF5682 family protein n=1 Tax=Streptacidiphilus sp. PB12-B1b TaxID=2705012 RepID=UPI0015FB69FE|nr:DUF5682 family protein [Streptacidiphilus sp. PB12-B1b]QMU79257.1 hypothetical protein GXW83_29680 [Streptacidiphilus sp. PB12-B1b]